MSLPVGESCLSGGVNGKALSDSVDFGLIGVALGGDVKTAVRSALAAGAIFPNGGDPVSIFRSTLADSIRDIERHPRGQLFRDFFTKGPYVDGGRIRKRERERFLTDAEVASVTAFIRKHGDGRRLYVTPLVPPHSLDGIEQTGRDDWRITLRWSKEALAEAAYETTFWYMGKVGEVLYSDPNVMPKDWSEMTPAEAGRNAAKMMLYYAGLRCRNAREEQRAIALYNAYSFGYAHGMNFRNKAGRREMLWPQDLDEIAANGCNKDGCRIG